MVFKYNIFWRAILEKLNCTKCLGEKLIKSAAARGECAFFHSYCMTLNLNL